MSTFLVFINNWQGKYEIADNSQKADWQYYGQCNTVGLLACIGILSTLNWGSFRKVVFLGPILIGYINWCLGMDK